jgi:hypothetical protein
MDVELYVDPSCAWSWATHRWLLHVAPPRQLRIELRPFSLAVRDEGLELPAVVVAARRQAHRALRVLATLPAPEARAGFFDALTAAFFARAGAGGVPEFDIAAALDASGCDPGLIAGADDAAQDAAVAATMAAAAQLFGHDDPRQVRLPVLVLHSARATTALHGPLLDPVPSGRQALRLWDAIEELAEHHELYEISRPRPRRHSALAHVATPSGCFHADPLTVGVRHDVVPAGAGHD